MKYQNNLKGLIISNIDHLKPLNSFKCKTFDDVINSKCNHWTNLIPTTPEYNLSKSDRLPNKKELFKQELRLYIFYKFVLNNKK